MIKPDIITEMAKRTEGTKVEATKYLDAFLDVVMDAMECEEEVKIVGFGKFEVKERAGREGRNPKTGESIVIPSKKFPTFKFSTKVRREFNEN